MPGDNQDPTELFLQHLSGAQVTSRLFPLVYDELRAIARSHLSSAGDGLLQPTALVHEVYLRLIDQTRLEVRERSHFLALAARTLHRVLIDHVRAARAAKRGGQAERITLRTGLIVDQVPSIDVLALDEALSALRGTNERRAEVVQLRFFGGLSIEEVAHVLGVAPRTVREDWTAARAYLYQKLAGRRE